MPATERSLAEIVGTQIAWWQLGFRRRREVIRLAADGRAHPDPVAWTDARLWAGQMLDSPWWWRIVRAVVISGFGVGGVAATAGVAVEFQADYAISIAVLTVAPLAVLWAWRQTRTARLINRVAPTERDPRANRRWVPILLLVLAFTAIVTSVAVIIHTARVNHEAVFGCPFEPEHPAIRESWIRHEGKSGFFGCPEGRSGTTAGGDPFQDTTTGVMMLTRTVGEFAVPDDLFEVWQAHWHVLGDPRSGPILDGFTLYVNFERGHISKAAGEYPVAVQGKEYQPAQVTGGPCIAHDRPCLISAQRDGTKIHLTWHWRIADAFNVSWHLSNQLRGPSVEVAGNEYTIDGVDPAAAYVVQIQACDKRFLRSSICTAVANYFVIPAN
ncbi:hypothetical protein DMH04_33375 [Kibdelosporangium aridum]|uniref:Uncharacterized protein n=1 Tax=Kibdelosporangium aridum TaxID=2030 RepID=A0A428Z133_KIBAR|nr:hypothetical protein [Kibdelosporangium aridum]RSM78556.1 hypothetical protein DMH04_33375 [Kibdelosporangium aridum]